MVCKYVCKTYTRYASAKSLLCLINAYTCYASAKCFDIQMTRLVCYDLVTNVFMLNMYAYENFTHVTRISSKMEKFQIDPRFQVLFLTCFKFLPFTEIGTSQGWYQSVSITVYSRNADSLDILYDDLNCFKL